MVKIGSEVARLNNLHLLNNRSKKNNSKGFYIALGICLIAVGVAAWTTYDSVVNYPAKDGTASSTQPVNQTASGVPVLVNSAQASQPASVAPESSKASAPASSAPSKDSSVPAKQTQAPVFTFQYPVGKTVIAKFSGESPIYSKTLKDWRVHTGIDLSAKQGDPVKSAADGTVKDVYADDAMGNTAVITHGTITAYYCGLGQTGVKKGEKVKKGQQIGTVGIVPSESAEEDHLHFAMMQNGKYIDPLGVLK